ncbi:MAG: aminopeptidase P family protein [Acidobacteria bacterium]|nr:aminopeptidase P family protein [Acidobacteriota bacterium]
MDERPQPAWTGRLHALERGLGAETLDGFVVSTPLNLVYLTGYAGSAGLVLITPRQRILIVDGRYDVVTREDIRAGRLAQLEVERVERRYDLTLGDIVKKLGLRRVGFESAHVTVSTAAAWQRAAPEVLWIPLEKVVERQRMIKDAAETAVLRKGGETLRPVVAALREILRPGRTEREVADGIDAAILAAGFERPSFPTIVASGPNSAHPHARPGNRALARGDLVVLDFGGVLDGYCVDLTRMAAIGEVRPEARALLTAVDAAHAAALASVRPGVLTSAIDAAARDALESRGLGQAFPHSTGHGLGLEIHEAPRIGRPDPETDEVVQAGMVFTIEPGAYVEGQGGVRLEDDVLVTAHGCDVLTDIPRQVLVI